jgi:MYXO-CTERM domain-containing protein
MDLRKPLLLALVALATGSADLACSSPAQEGDDGASALSETEKFDKNNVLSNAALMDGTHITHAELQRFLEKTPWNKRSALADYETDSGKRASVVMQEAAETYGINPLELLVRAQMEQRLISRTADEVVKDGDEDKLDIAFGCGCPHAPVCKTEPAKYTGFENQAKCAAKLIADDYKTLEGGKALRNNWRPNRMITTEDGVDVTPANNATAILYSYTPYAGGKAGGKDAKVGGVYLHWEIWQSFAGALGYKAPGTAVSTDGGATASDAGASRDSGATTRDSGATTRDAGPAPGPCDGPDPDPDLCADAGGPSPSRDGGAATADGGPSTESGSSGEDDPGTAHEPDPQPSPPPAKSKPKKTSSGPTELGDGGADDGSSGKKESGCSASPASPAGSPAAALGLALAAAMVLARRRRS